MKIYFHMNTDSFTNTYLVVNEESRKALIIDPSKMTKEIIDQLEDGKYELSGVLITHNHKSHTSGLPALKKIYNAPVYAADSEISADSTFLSGDGKMNVADLEVEYYSVPFHTVDSIVYKIQNVLFTGDVIYAGRIGSSSCNYTAKRLCASIQSKLFTMPDSTVIMPGHGPLSSIGAEKLFNTELEDRPEENA